jgi:hypothetical protein
MTLNFSRFLQLTKIELTENFKKAILINGLIFFTILFLSTLSYFFDSGTASVDLHSNLLGVIFIGGIILGSLSFSELFKRHTRINYLNLPASASEKVLSKAFVNILLYPLSMFALFLLAKGIFTGLDSLTDGAIYIADRFEMKMTLLIPSILLCISVFFYGAVRFNAYGFVYTIISIILIFLTVAAFAFICAYLIFPELRMAIAGNEPDNNISIGPNMENHWLIQFYKVLFYLAPAIFVALSIICLKEKEG